jgi:nucleoside-diphosphate-sugar epimerase
LIYFSTLSINDRSKADSLYVQHKKKIEEYIQNHSKQFSILRIGNIVGSGGNPNTLFNYLKHQIAHNSEFYCIPKQEDF